MSDYVLSKSTFIRGCQCEKSLWLYKNKYKLRKISKETQLKFDRGNAIGVFAQKIFPGGINSKPDKPWNLAEAVKMTQNYIFYDKKVIYEAAFAHSDVYVALDILVSEGNKWIAYEVKSSEQVSETYILDCALQYYVITKSGLTLNDFVIIYVNKDYINEKQIDVNNINEDEIDINRFFVTESVLDKVIDLQGFISQKIDSLKKIPASVEPEIPVGNQCVTPYECDYYEYCHSRLF